MPPSLLLIGIAWDQYEAMVSADKAPEMVTRMTAAIVRDEQSFKDFGLEYHYLDYAPGESMQRLEKVLQEKEFSGVGIGIHANAQFTTMFEALVNYGTLEAAKRWFPEAGNTKK